MYIGLRECKEHGRLTLLLCIFPNSAEYPFPHEGKMGSLWPK